MPTLSVDFKLYGGPVKSDELPPIRDAGSVAEAMQIIRERHPEAVASNGWKMLKLGSLWQTAFLHVWEFASAREQDEHDEKAIAVIVNHGEEPPEPDSGLYYGGRELVWDE